MAGVYDIDLQLFHDAIGAIDDCLDNFRMSKANIEKTIENLNSSGWKSPAASKYILECESWIDLLNSQIIDLEFIKKGVVLARDKYLSVSEELGTVYFTLA